MIKSTITTNEKSIEDQFYELIAATKDMNDINIPCSNHYFTNSKNQKLHFRFFYDNTKPIKALIVYLHGF